MRAHPIASMLGASLTANACAMGATPGEVEQIALASGATTALSSEDSTATTNPDITTWTTANATTGSSEGSEGELSSVVGEDEDDAGVADIASETEGSDTADSSEESPSPSCDDAELNQDESDIDCGGERCSACVNGKICNVDGDCRSGACAEGLCVAGECSEDDDCQHLNGSCRGGRCNADTHQCEEYDLPEDTACATDDYCQVQGRCEAGQCHGRARDCGQLDTACEQGRCDAVLERCVAEPAHEGEVCDDGDACTSADRCQLGRCRGQTDPLLLVEDFTDPDPGWQMQRTPSGGPSLWQIGPALSREFCDIGNDPSHDHSGMARGALAGVNIGGCAPTMSHEDWDCLVSPTVAIYNNPAIQVAFYRHLATDSGDFSSETGVLNRVEVQYDDGPWLAIEQGYDASVIDSNWRRFAVTLGSFEGERFRFRVCYSNRGQPFPLSFAGWSIDDVELRNRSCDPI